MNVLFVLIYGATWTSRTYTQCVLHTYQHKQLINFNVSVILIQYREIDYVVESRKKCKFL